MCVLSATTDLPAIASCAIPWRPSAYSNIVDKIDTIALIHSHAPARRASGLRRRRRSTAYRDVGMVLKWVLFLLIVCTRASASGGVGLLLFSSALSTSNNNQPIGPIPRLAISIAILIVNILHARTRFRSQRMHKHTHCAKSRPFAFCTRTLASCCASTHTHMRSQVPPVLHNYVIRP